MPGRRAPDAEVGHSVGLEVDGVRVAMLTEVGGLAMERDVIELKQNGPDGKVVVKKLPGESRSGEVVVSRGLTGDRTFEQWMNDAGSEAVTARRNASIVLLDHEGQVVATFTLANAWPRRLEFANLRSGGTEVPVERLVLVHEGIARA